MSAPPTDLPEWGLTERHRSGAAAAVLGVAAAAAVAAGASIGALSGPPVGIGVTAVLLGALVLWVASQASSAVRRTGGRRVTESEHPRLRNIVAGLAADLRMSPPEVLLVDEGEPNALIAPGTPPRLVVAKSLVETFTLTEVEAVVAHCLARVVSGDATHDARAMATFGLGAPPIGEFEDVRAAAITRYPPALAGAIGKAHPRSGRLWFVGDSRTHEPPEDRIRRLNDL